MTAPTFVAASTGATDATGAWVATCHAPGAAGRLIILQVLQDGSGAAPTFTSATNIEDLTGTDNAWTVLGTAVVGTSSEAKHHLWVGRSLSTSAPTFTGGNSSGDDLYFRCYEFQDVNTGTTLSDILENTTAGTISTDNATNATMTPRNVGTTASDRLAINFCAVNDDVTIALITGMSGGTWVEVAEYSDSGGTDGAIQLQYAAMPTAGTLSGGSAALSLSAAWGVIDFALIGTTVAAAKSLVIPHRHRGLIVR